MKKTLYLITLLACFCLIWQNASSQDDCGDLSSSISEKDANGRIELFAKHKTTCLRDQKISFKPLVIPVEEMKDMLKYFLSQDSSKNYDGLRIYFITPEHEIKDSARLSILFVPTIEVIDLNTHEPIIDDCNYRISKDDFDNAYYFSQDHLHKIDESSRSRTDALLWRIAYGELSAKIPGAIHRKFEESKSTWYSKEVFFKVASSPDLLTYLICKKVQNIEVYFASYHTKVLPSSCNALGYKTHPIFKFDGAEFKSSFSFFTLAAKEIKSNFKTGKFKKFVMTPAYTDTGLPCPPNKCN